MQVTVFRNIFDTTEPMYYDVLEVFKRIKDGNSKAVIKAIRDEKDGDRRQDIKKRLPSICFSGRFGKREAEALLEHSGLMCLDIDEVSPKDMEAIRAMLENQEVTFALFESPSGNGFKIIIKIHNDKSQHRPQFLALEKHFNELLFKYTSTKENRKKRGDSWVKIDEAQGKYLRVHIDKSGKDVNRVCYESYDPKMYYNPDSEVWVEVLDEKTTQKEVEDVDIVIEKLQIWINKQETYYKGNRNNYLYKLSSAMCRYGVDMMRCTTYLHKNYEDYPLKELESTVKGAYKANDFGTEQFTEKEKRTKFTPIAPIKGKDVTAFWSINDKGRVKIDAKQFLNFIAANGFGIYRQDGSVGKWHFVHVHNMVVDIVDVVDIKKHVLDYVEKHAPEPVYDELQMRNRYFENTFLNALPQKEVVQIRDRDDRCYIFFDEFYYEITSKAKTKHMYVDLEGQHIWRSQICKQTITKVVDYDGDDFPTFVFRAMGENLDSYRSACAAIGYGIHTYKKKRLAKLVYACDNSKDELDGEASGGTGKNLFFECLRYCRAVVDIDGKDFDKRDKFKFQTVSPDTQIVNIDDYEGDIKELFTKVTGHFEIERKGLDKKVIPFDESPKLFVSSNSAPGGYSSSYTRRLQLIEFTDYYNSDKTPSDEFGDKDFFSDDWTQDDWNSLYSWLFDCVQYYFNKGLTKISNGADVRYKQLVKAAGREFADYFIDLDLSEYTLGVEILDKYIDETRDKDMTTQKMYSRLRKMSHIYGWVYEINGRGSKRKIKIVK